MGEGILYLVTNFWLARSRQGPWSMGDHHGCPDRFREDLVSVPARRSARPPEGPITPGYRCMIRRVTVSCGKPR